MNRDNLKIKEFHKKLELAREYLKGAENALEDSSFRVATDLAYNAAELVMKMAILLKDQAVPKRHGSVAQLFSLLYIKEGPLERKMGQKVSDGLEFRSQARYGENAEITKEHALHNINLAQSLAKFLEKELRMSWVEKSAPAKVTGARLNRQNIKSFGMEFPQSGEPLPKPMRFG